MTENLKPEQIDQVADQHTEADQETDEKGRIFTQQEVSRIVADRIKRVKEKADKDHAQALADLQAELAQGIDSQAADLEKRENKLLCREYLIDNGYPVSLLDIINTDNVDEFRTKADRAHADIVQTERQRLTPPPLRSTENHHEYDRLDLKSAFANTKHTPKKF